MPTYRYRCGGCGDEFEVWQSIKDDALTTHDDGCGGPVVKVLTPAGIVLKGSGFYKNDSRSSTRAGGAKDRDKDGAGEKKGDTPASDGASTKGGDTGGSSTGGDGGTSKGTSEKSGPSSGEGSKTGAATS